jgi:hypothetical protein
MHASSLLFIGLGSSKLGQKWFLRHARPDESLGPPDEQLFSCPESNSRNFYRAVRTQDVSVLMGAVWVLLLAVWKLNFHYFFLSFPTTPISSQSDFGVKCYDQNNRGCPDGLIERPDGKLQLPFQNSTESFNNKATSGRYCPSVWTVAIQLHVITIIRLGESGP